MATYLRSLYNSIMGVKPVEPVDPVESYAELKEDDGDSQGPAEELDLGPDEELEYDEEFQGPVGDSDLQGPDGDFEEDTVLTGGGRMVLGNAALVTIILAMSVFQR